MVTESNNIARTFQRRDGLTLVEVLVAMVMTLIVLGVMTRAFSFASLEMSRGRASLEMTNRLRAVQTLLNNDLRRLTVETKPYFGLAELPKGYFELVEGPLTDVNALINDTTTATDENTLNNLAVGDYDDIWMGTIQTEDRPFKGRLEITDATGTNLQNVSLQKSKFAEVAWFTTFSLSADGNTVAEPVDGDQIRLYRRQLLIDPQNPDLLAELTKINPLPSLAAVNRFFQENDFSLRVDVENVGGGIRFRLIPNSLEDLAIRGNRFCHTNITGANATNPPDLDLPQNRILNIELLPNRLASNQEDVVLTNCIGFDLKVFSPDARSLVEFVNSGASYQIRDYARPSDIGATVVRQANVAGNNSLFVEDFLDGVPNNDPTFHANATHWSRLGGEYVDLGASRVPTTAAFQKVAFGVTSSPDPGVLGRAPFPLANPQLPATGTANFPLVPAYSERVYDTGTSFYDRNLRPSGLNGIDDDNDGLIDEVLDSESLTDLDTNNDGILDSFEERIRPPYNVRLRGLQISIRALERNSGQIRQLTLRSSLSPQ